MTGGPADGGGPNGPVFDPPLSLPTPPPVEGEEGGHRKRVLWAFGAAAALFGVGIVGLSLPSNQNDGVNVKTDDTVGPTTTLAPTNDRTRSLVAPVFAPFTFSAAGVANTTTVPAGNPNGSLPSVSPKTLAALAGVVAKGATTITLTPPPPVTNTPTPVVQNNNPQPGTLAPGTSTGPTSPPTTKPPKPTTTTTAPTTTDPPTTVTEPPTTVIDTTTTVPDTTTTVPDTTTIPDSTTTTVPDTTTIPDTTTTTVAATTTSFDPPTTPAPTDPPTTPAPTEPPTTPAPTDPPTTPAPTDPPPTVPFI